MSFRAKSWLVAILLCWAPTAVFAQTVTDIELGETRQQKAGGTSDMYRFTGLTGTTVTAKLATTGDAALVFYTPDGEEMLSVEGNGSIKLDVILPFPDVYFVAVVRSDATTPYSLKLDSVVPDDHLSFSAEGVGYRGKGAVDDPNVAAWQCWIEPGVKGMIKGKPWTREITLGRGGMEYVLWRHLDGRTVSEQTRITFDGTNVTFSFPNDSREPITEARRDSFRSDAGEYLGYLCG